MSDEATQVDAFWWKGVEEERLLFQTCDACDAVNFYPRIRCVKCMSPRLSWRESTKQGTVYACTFIHRAPTADLAGEAPYFVVLADMDDGFRFMARLRKGPQQDISVGSRLTVVFEETKDKKIPCFEAV